MIKAGMYGMTYFIKNWENIDERDIYFTPNEWVSISEYQYLPEAFIEKFKNLIHWDSISSYQILSEEFVEKYEGKINWGLIIIYQNLSEDFIEKYENKIDWHCLSQFKKLSEGFIYKHRDNNIDLCCLEKYYIGRDFDIFSKNAYSLIFININNGLKIINRPYAIILSEII